MAYERRQSEASGDGFEAGKNIVFEQRQRARGDDGFEKIRRLRETTSTSPRTRLLWGKPWLTRCAGAPQIWASMKTQKNLGQ